MSSAATISSVGTSCGSSATSIKRSDDGSGMTKLGLVERLTLMFLIAQPRLSIVLASARKRLLTSFCDKSLMRCCSIFLGTVMVTSSWIPSWSHIRRRGFKKKRIFASSQISVGWSRLQGHARKPATIAVGRKSAIKNGTCLVIEKKERYRQIAAMAAKINCLRVKGPNSLSSASISCRTL